MTYGQDTLPFFDEEIIIPGNIIAKPGEWYIDTIKVKAGKWIVHIDNIKDINSYKGPSAEYFSGAISAVVISRKIQYEIQPLSTFLKNIKKTNKKLGEEEDIEVFIDSVLIEDVSDYVIELNPNIEIEFVYFSEEGVYHGGSGNKPKPQIFIRTSKSINETK
jgi:hypothetical protein